MHIAGFQMKRGSIWYQIGDIISTLRIFSSLLWLMNAKRSEDQVAFWKQFSLEMDIIYVAFGHWRENFEFLALVQKVEIRFPPSIWIYVASPPLVNW